MKKVKLSTTDIAKGIKAYKSFTVPVGTELNTAISISGIFQVDLPVRGSSALLNISLVLTAGQSAIISDPRATISLSDTPDKVCLYRKVEAGPIFIKNNSVFNQTVILTY